MKNPGNKLQERSPEKYSCKSIESTISLTALGKDNPWVDFLEDYFSLTMRPSRDTEDGVERPEDENPEDEEIAAVDLVGIAGEWMHILKKPAGGLEKPTGGYEKPTGGSGLSCMCPSIKNYPKDVV